MGVLLVCRPSVAVSNSKADAFSYNEASNTTLATPYNVVLSDADIWTHWRVDVAQASTNAFGMTSVGIPAGTVPAGATINNVNFHIRGWCYPNSGVATLKVYAKVGSGGTRALYYNPSGPPVQGDETGMESYLVNMPTNPTGGAWTVSDLNALIFEIEFGAKNVTNSVSNRRVSEITMDVTYTPAVVGAPTAVTPANAATVTVPNPVLGATLTASGSGQRQIAEWQIASDAGFTTNVKTISEANTDLRVSGATTESPTIVNLNLANGTWYLRARGIDEYGTPGAYSATNTITVNTPVLPTPTVITPASGSTVTTLVPNIGATLGVDSAGRLQKAEWQVTSDSTFASVQRDIIENDSDMRASGATTEALPLSLKLTNDGTWWIRARSVGNDGTVSAWSAGQSFTLDMPAPPVPTLITPAAGATLPTNTPTLGATLGAATENRTVKAEWQLATDSGFTANVKVVTEDTVDLRASGATTEVIPTASKLFQTLWYMRAREIDQYGQASAYTASQTFTVAHLPTGTPSSPINGAAIVWGATLPFAWVFSDPAVGDSQTAYQVIVERNDTGAAVLDTGKVTSTVASAALAITTTYKDVQLRWKVRVWDTDNVAGNYSPYQAFTASDLPVVTITSPTAGQQITTGQPTVTWTNDAATIQASRRVIIRRTSDNALIYDTGVVNSNSTTWTAPATILENNTGYTVTVTIVDALGMTGTATRTFSTFYLVPATVGFVVDASGYDTLGYINVDWSTQIPDNFFVDWRVYRRLSTATTWELIYVTTNQYTSHFHDWTATASDLWQYTVTQTAGRSGLILESSMVPSSSVLADGSHYWLLNPDDETDNLKIANVTGDSFTDDYDEEELIIIGRGRKVNLGTRHGYTGSLDAQFRTDTELTARQKRLKLQILKESRTTYQMRNPFGDLFEVSLGNIGIGRVAGVGTAEFVDVTIPYKEVF